jgi:hypothetical protein
MFVRSYLYVPSGTPITGVIVHGISEESTALRRRQHSARGRSLQHRRSPARTGPGPDLRQRSRQRAAGARHMVVPAAGGASVHPTEGAVRLRVDGRLVAESTEPLDTQPATGYRGVSAGLVYLDPAQEAPLQLYVDELVADTARIGCD